MTDPKKDEIVLDCAEFQEQLPQMFAIQGEIEERPELRAHLATCSNCSALVRDLEYIAEQARLLMEPTHDPSPEVWSNIQSKLTGHGKPN
ncbi:MAG TPA: hypothetical protein VNU94_00170 [Acidobacteriaceae bacterium]|jgi:hypothetical protein|nr:hypothetical protein [Acidobacteriaceae bacterium]